MKLGAYTACLHDKTLEETLTILRDLGLNSVEINSGGFIGTPHLPVEELLESAEAPARRQSGAWQDARTPHRNNRASHRETTRRNRCPLSSDRECCAAAPDRELHATSAITSPAPRGPAAERIHAVEQLAVAKENADQRGEIVAGPIAVHPGFGRPNPPPKITRR